MYLVDDFVLGTYLDWNRGIGMQISRVDTMIMLVSLVREGRSTSFRILTNGTQVLLLSVLMYDRYASPEVTTQPISNKPYRTSMSLLALAKNGRPSSNPMTHTTPQ